MRGSLLPAILVIGLACAKSSPSHSPTPLNTQAADQITDLVTEALTADARLERADSLYDPAVLITANGNRRGGVPRYAASKLSTPTVLREIRSEGSARNNSARP